MIIILFFLLPALALASFCSRKQAVSIGRVIARGLLLATGATVLFMLGLTVHEALHFHKNYTAFYTALWSGILFLGLCTAPMRALLKNWWG